MIKFLDLHAQYQTIKSEMDDAIQSVIFDSAYIGGKYVSIFEENFAKYIGVDHCVGVGNGTDALEIALETLKLPPKSEVIVPANSFFASAEAVARTGLSVVFCDVEPNTYNLDIADLRTKITSNTSAIVAVHLYGQPCDMDPIVSLAKQFNLKVIEDCAQAHGAEYKGRKVGGIGDIGCFSFYPGKNLGAYGDGGAIVTNETSYADYARMLSNHGRADKYNHQFVGRNSRLDGLQAAIITVKLKYLDSWVQRRNEVAQLYFEGLRESKILRLPTVDLNYGHAYHLFVVQTEYRELIREQLNKNGIETGIHYPIALTKFSISWGQGVVSAKCEKAEELSHQVLSLPIGEHLSDNDVAKVIHAIILIEKNLQDNKINV
jgi:dTDP-4-amino-4,6-dideoxygalactose transaminase